MNNWIIACEKIPALNHYFYGLRKDCPQSQHDQALHSPSTHRIRYRTTKKEDRRPQVDQFGRLHTQKYRPQQSFHEDIQTGMIIVHAIYLILQSKDTL